MTKKRPTGRPPTPLDADQRKLLAAAKRAADKHERARGDLDKSARAAVAAGIPRQIIADAVGLSLRQFINRYVVVDR